MRRTTSRSPWQRLILMTATILALVGGYYWGSQYQSQYQLQQAGPPLQNLNATLLSDTPPLEDLALTTFAGTPFVADDLKGQWTFLFFGCAGCPDTSSALIRLLRTRNRLADRPGLQQATQMVLVAATTRDQGGELPQERWLSNFGPIFTGIGGTQEQISRLSQWLGLADGEPAQKDPVLFLISPTGAPVALFTPDLTAEDIVSDFKRIVDHHEG